LLSIKAHDAKSSPLFLRVITDDTPFYSSLASDSPLFNLPYTYYVKLLNETGSFFHVEVYGDQLTPALDGYVPASMLFSDGLSTPYPYLSLSIRSASTAVLYEDNQLTESLQYIFPEREMIYYGKLSSPQGIIYYVSYNNKLGYVKESNVYPFEIPNHPNELTFLKPETPPAQEGDETISEDYFGLRIIIIICLIFAGIIALFVALNKKPAQSVVASYYDDNDYQ
jgi:hypothetical protein